MLQFGLARVDPVSHEHIDIALFEPLNRIILGYGNESDRLPVP